MLRLWKKNQAPISIDFFLLFPMVPLFLLRNAFFRTKTRVEYWKPFFSKYIMRAWWPVSAGRSHIYYGIFHWKWTAQNLKSSETLFNLFIIMKKTQKTIFSAIYANVQKLFLPQNFEILIFFTKKQFLWFFLVMNLKYFVEHIDWK